jgi:hypothetical protein
VTKRPRKPPTKRELDEIERLAQESPGLGLSHRLSDRAFWRNWTKLDPLYDTWIDLKYKSLPLIDLLDEIDRTLDPKLLLPLLNVPPEALPHFEDLFERLNLKRSRKNNRTPSYQRTEQQIKLEHAKWRVMMRPRGKTQAQAIAEVAQSEGIDKKTLERVIQGQHSSLRRQARRSRGHK